MQNNYIRHMAIRIILLSIMLAAGMRLSAQQVAVKNNLLYDATGTPNLTLEFRLSDHWTAGISSGYRPWPTDEMKTRKWKHLLVAPQARYWFCESFRRDFFGMTLLYSHFNVADVKFPLGLYPSVKDNRRQGDLVGAGVSYGYSWILSPHWSLEAEGGIDLGYAWYKEYDCAHCGTYHGKDSKPFLAPKLGISIVYNIK